MNEENTKEEELTVQVTKKSHRKIKIFATVILFLIITITLVAGWLGFIPGLSDLMGANKPRDLGIKYTKADYESYQRKAEASFLDLDDAPSIQNNFGDKLIFDRFKYVEGLSLTQEEITATVNEIGWALMPISNAQVRISDSIVEISGNLNLDYMVEFTDFIGGIGYNKKDIQKAVSFAKNLSNRPPIYVKVNASVIEDNLSLKLEDIKIGRISAPHDIAEKVLSTGTANAIHKIEKLETKSATFEGDGTLKFDGTYPTIVYVGRIGFSSNDIKN